MKRLLSFVVGLTLLSNLAIAADEPITKIATPAPTAELFEKVPARKPLEITTKEQVLDFYGEEKGKEILEKVDLEKRKIVLFAWRGSGQDNLDFSVAESFPEQIFFTIKLGRTRDLRPHVHAFSLRKNVSFGMAKAS